MEEETQKNIINIGEQDEIVEIIEKIRNVQGKTVTLYIPKGAVILQDVTNLKILQRKTKEMGKDISIAKASTTELFSEARREMPKMPESISKTANGADRFSSLAPKTNRISDMVSKKGETVDLRSTNPGQMENKKKAEIKAVGDTMASAPIVQQEKKDAVFALPFKETERELEEEDFLSKINQDKKMAEVLTDASSKKINATPTNAGVRRIEREELFDDRSRLIPDMEKGKKFDFSYGNEKKKQRSSILPTISAKFFAAFILVCILTAAISLYFMLPKATIAIAMKTESVQGDFTLVADKDISEIDVSNSKVPAKVSDVVSEKTQTFTTAGKKRVTEKASGNLTILNECSTGDQILVAGTRFLSKDTGKIFKVETSVTIPGFTKPEDATVPGAKTVKVVAEEAGESYNINATAFTIPKLQELASWKYSCLYARSDKPMTGGLDKEVNYLAQADYDKAKDTLTALVKGENTGKLTEQQSADLIYLVDQSDEGKISVKSAAKVNDVADRFDMTVSITKSILTIQKTHTEALLTEKIKTTDKLSGAQAVGGSLTYKVGDTTEKDKQISFDVSASQNFIYELNADDVKKDVAGKNKQELNDYFAKINGIKSISINLWPFWVNKVPTALDKINVTLDNSDSA